LRHSELWGFCGGGFEDEVSLRCEAGVGSSGTRKGTVRVLGASSGFRGRLGTLRELARDPWRSNVIEMFRAARSGAERRTARAAERCYIAVATKNRIATPSVQARNARRNATPEWRFSPRPHPSCLPHLNSSFLSGPRNKSESEIPLIHVDRRPKREPNQRPSFIPLHATNQLQIACCRCSITFL
jgi:hypothetical protein